MACRAVCRRPEAALLRAATLLVLLCCCAPPPRGAHALGDASGAAGAHTIGGGAPDEMTIGYGTLKVGGVRLCNCGALRCAPRARLCARPLRQSMRDKTHTCIHARRRQKQTGGVARPRRAAVVEAARVPLQAFPVRRRVRPPRQHGACWAGCCGVQHGPLRLRGLKRVGLRAAPRARRCTHHRISPRKPINLSHASKNNTTCDRSRAPR